MKNGGMVREKGIKYSTHYIKERERSRERERDPLSSFCVAEGTEEKA